MSRKPFYLSLRSGVWYAKIVDPKTGNQLSALSTGHTDRDAAVLTVSRWLVEGIPQKRINSKKDVSEALTVNRLFNVLNDIDLTNQEAEKIMCEASDWLQATRRWQCLSIMPTMPMKIISRQLVKQQRRLSVRLNNAIYLRGENDSKQRFLSRFLPVI